MTDGRPDIRWIQRLSNYNKALSQLTNAMQKREYNELEQQGVIQSFEYCYELAWKTLQDLLIERGFIDIIGPKPVLQKAFEAGYIQDGQGWMLMIQSRNITSHTYDEKKAHEIVDLVRTTYHNLMLDLALRLNKEVLV